MMNCLKKKNNCQITLVTDYLESSAEKYPKKTAFADDCRSVTFSELRNEALAIATHLIEMGVYKKPVAVYLDKRVECIVSFLGSVYSGNFYAPIDIKAPLERVRVICDILNPEVIITDEDNYANAMAGFEGKTILLYDEIRKKKIKESMVYAVLKTIIDTDLLYIIFTSGSTGIPKGVAVNHRSLISYTEWAGDTFGINSEDILGNQTPLYFSMSVFDIYVTLRNGCTTYLIPKRLFSWPIDLMKYLHNNKITTLYWVPTALCIIANRKALGHVDISCVKRILFAGEPMPAKQLNMWIDELPDALFANLFGPTETTDICVYYVVKRKLENDEPVPIGDACTNCSYLILDNNNREAKEGELCIRGSFLASGYYNSFEKTSEVFVQNPLNDSYPEIIYRTGDLVTYNKYGELIYLGRKDSQIKHMGHRIELGEIETAVSAGEHIENCCAIYDDERKRIVLYYSGNYLEEGVRNMLKNKLPEYMIPSKICRYESLPLNANGKIDRKALKNTI